jgi:hypothetical protein
VAYDEAKAKLIAFDAARNQELKRLQEENAALRAQLSAQVKETADSLHDDAVKLKAAAVRPIAWATHHDEPMLFPTLKEAAMYCDDGEEPIPLVAQHPADADAVDAKLQSIYTLLMRGNIEIGEAYLTLNVVGVPPTKQEFCAAIAAQSTEGAKG